VETLKQALAVAAQKLQKGDVKGALASLKPLLDPTIEPATRLEALRIVALARLLAGERKGARQAMDEAVEVAKALSPSHQGKAFERRALIRQDDNDYSGARADLEQAAASFASSGEAALRANVEDRAAALAAGSSELERAVAGHLTAAALASGALPANGERGAHAPRKTGEPSADASNEALYLVHAAAASHLGGKLDLSRTALERALSVQPKDSALRAQTLHNLGVVLSDLGEHDAAIEKLEAALASDAARGAIKDAIASRLRLALASRRKGDLARAREEAKKARAEAEPTKDVPLLVEALLELSSAELGLKAFEPALAAAKDAVAAAKDDSRLLARTTLHSAVCARAIGKKETARAGFKMARELAEAAGESVLAAAAVRELKSLE